MVNKKNQRGVLLVLSIYLVCFAFRIFEYFVLRTDRTWVGEAVVHKLIGILVLFICAGILHFTTAEIGFSKEGALANLGKGLAFGLCTFAVAYTVECLIINSLGNFDSLKLYVSTYAIDKNLGNNTSLLFFLICIAGNIINVLMEEGVFRGLFNKILSQKYSFILSALIASALFGFWHIVGPVRNFFDGESSMAGTVANAIMLVFTSALVGFKFAMLTKITGSIFMGMGDHFVNNTIVNILHVVSKNGADQMMAVRVALAQSLSFILVLIWFAISSSRNRRTK
ncbi:MAG: CPBP family intramembrane metalloprotease [Treponema sp.]|nr:CPBP family intramembrane metalloprotease [Treponema sp.]